MANTFVKYRTFDELMDEVRTDFFTYEMEGMIEPGQLIKVAQRINYDLGLRINTEKQKVLEIINGRVKLPDDFYVLTMAVLCADYHVKEEVMQGRHTENVIVEPTATCCNTCKEPESTCACESTYVVCEDTYVKVIEKRNYLTREFREFKRLWVRPARAVDPICSKKPEYDNWMEAELRDGYLYVIGIETGTVYVNYLGNLEDENGNLLVLDHPMINEYYEYAIKQRILENLYMNGEDVTQKMQLVEQRMRPARNNALTIVNTPDFKEMYNVWKMNREAMYGKYYNMFKSYYINL
jgi:hypothetical protein